METNKVLSALCYFSMLFAGFIFPLVVFFVTNDPTTKNHAKKALISHLLPIVPVPFLIAGILTDFAQGAGSPRMFTISCIIVVVIISITVFIWNIVKGVKVLMQKSIT
jgi:uncharacterized membrane protein YhdT